MSFIEELKRRNVFRVGAAYVLMAWVVLQGADFALDLVDAPNWVIQALSIAAAAGFPIALILAWALELTPEGVKLEKNVDRTQSITPNTGKRLDRVIIGVLALVIIFMAAERLFFAGSSEPVSPPDAAQASAEAHSPKSIAVLPFADMSQAGDQQWFADGLAEEILNSLARTPDLMVTSRTSSFKYRDSDLDMPQIARELNVAHVLEGSVRQAGDRVRVTAQLIRAEDGFHLWSQNYDRDVADMIAIQEDLAVQIAQALETSMDPAALAEMARMGTDSVEAYREYIRARQLHVEGFTTVDAESNMQQNFDAVRAAIALDPNFSAAHFLLAELWRIQLSPSRPGSDAMATSPQEALNHFHHAIGSAIRTAVTEEDRLLFRAVQALVDMRLRDASSMVSQYVDKRPNDWSAWRLYTDIAWVTHEPADMRRVLSHQKERIPIESFAATEYLNLSFLQDDLREAVEVAKESLVRWPGQSAMEYQAHRMLLWAGEIDLARPLAARYPADGDNWALMQIRQACAEGRVDDAVALFENAVLSNDEDALSSWLILSILGRQDEAEQLFHPIVTSGIAYQLADLSGYPQFGPTGFPSLMVVFEREGLPLRAPRPVPYACPPPEPPSIAVLPFVNMSSDPEKEFFSDGISEEILNVLTTIPNLKVAARTSSFQFKDRNLDISEIAQQLGVGHVLEGSVRSSGDQVRVTAQLIQASDGFHVWSETWDRELNDIFAIQDEIASAIASVLREAIAPEDLPQSQPVDLAAYELFLKGRSLVAMRGAENLNNGIELLKQSLEIEPGFADAMASLATAFSVLPYYSVLVSTAEVYAEAKQWAQQALDLEAENVDALAVLGMLRYLVDYQYEESERLMLRALDLGPANVTTHNFLGDLYMRIGDLERAERHEARALELDPLGAVQWMDLGNVALIAGDYEEALRLHGRALELAPEFGNALANMLDAALVLGDREIFSQVRTHAQGQPQLQPMLFTLVDLYEAVLDGDQQRIAAAMRQRLEELEQGYETVVGIANDSAFIGDYTLSAQMLERALQQQDGVWQFPLRVRLPEQAPDNAAWQAFWAKPGPARLAELRRQNGFPAEPPKP